MHGPDSRCTPCSEAPMSRVATTHPPARGWLGLLLLVVIACTSCDSIATTGGSTGGLALVTSTAGIRAGRWGHWHRDVLVAGRVVNPGIRADSLPGDSFPGSRKLAPQISEARRPSRCRASLPLLGSNQDSPDPESGVLPVTPRGTAAFDCHGAEGDRTPDLCSAIAALSQLSYSPRGFLPRGRKASPGGGFRQRSPRPDRVSA
jgi:hypothetical protein